MTKELKQKFHHGDLVRVADDLGPDMRHFTSGCDAIVQYSYNDEYGGGDIDSYNVYIEGQGSTAWYHEHQLSLIDPARHDLLAKWKEAADKDREVKSDLDWIFLNGKEVLEKGYGASIEALAACFGLDNLWGSHGEGFVWHNNAVETLNFAAPFLVSGDKDGYLRESIRLKEAHEAKQ